MDKQLDLMNEIEEHGKALDDLVFRLRTYIPGDPLALDQRWVSIGELHLQDGLMALHRSVAKATTF